MITGTSNYDEIPVVLCKICGGYYKADEPEMHVCLDRCPRCKEDMLAGQKLCRNCQWEDNMDEWPGGEGVECDICGHISADPEGRHFCSEDNSDE